MPPKYTVEFYVDADGNIPVQDYMFEGNDETKVGLLINVIQRLEALGPSLRDTDMDKGIEDPIGELRKDRHRILYGRIVNHYVLLSAFLKKTQKTPSNEIELAKKRFEVYLGQRK